MRRLATGGVHSDGVLPRYVPVASLPTWYLPLRLLGYVIAPERYFGLLQSTRGFVACITVSGFSRLMVRYQTALKVAHNSGSFGQKNICAMLKNLSLFRWKWSHSTPTG